MQRIRIDTSDPKKFEATFAAILRTGTVVFTSEEGVYKVDGWTIRKLKEQGINLKVLDENGRPKGRRNAR